MKSRSPKQLAKGSWILTFYFRIDEDSLTKAIFIPSESTDSLCNDHQLNILSPMTLQLWEKVSWGAFCLEIPGFRRGNAMKSLRESVWQELIGVGLRSPWAPWLAWDGGPCSTSLHISVAGGAGSRGLTSPTSLTRWSDSPLLWNWVTACLGCLGYLDLTAIWKWASWNDVTKHHKVDAFQKRALMSKECFCNLSVCRTVPSWRSGKPVHGYLCQLNLKTEAFSALEPPSWRLQSKPADWAATLRCPDSVLLWRRVFLGDITTKSFS